MSNLIIVHPINEELRFFRKTIRKLRQSNYLITLLRLSNNFGTHKICLDKLKQSSNNDLIIFFCHGHTNSILGCSYQNDLSSHPNRYVHEEHGYFLNGSNVDILQNKKIICIACNSNSFGRLAVSAGTKAFLGFDEINFDFKDLILNNKWNKHVINLTKWKFRQSIFWAITNSLEYHLSFYQFSERLKLVLNKHSTDILLNYKKMKKFKYYKRTAYCLDEMRIGIQVQGNINEKL